MGITKNKPLLAGVGIVAAAFVAWLAFGFFGIQAAFIDEEVNETTDGLFDTSADSGTAETVTKIISAGNTKRGRSDSTHSATRGIASKNNGRCKRL